IAYQDIGCNERQLQTEIPLAPALRFAPTPQHATERAHEPRIARSTPPLLRERERGPHEMAYECRTRDGRVFYRLGPCPHSIAKSESTGATAQPHHGKGAGTHSAKGSSVQVASQRVPRELACREIHRAAAIGRDGHEFDEHVSTYEHN